MKIHLLRLLIILLVAWPKTLIHAQDPSYTVQDFEGEYGIAFSKTEMVDVDQRVPIESSNPQEILDQLLKIIADYRMDRYTKSAIAGNYFSLKENFEANYVIKDGQFISSGASAEEVSEKIVKADQPTPLPLLETEPLSSESGVGYLVLDKYDLYHIAIEDYEETGQVYLIQFLRKKDQSILNDQIDQPLYNSLLPEGVTFDEYGYQTIPYDQLVNGETIKLTVTGKIIKIIDLESYPDLETYAYKFIIEAGDGNEQYLVKWNTETKLDIHEGDIVYIRGNFTEWETESESKQRYPEITVDPMNGTIEKVD
ncbi:hypothetical protein ACWOBX_05000 [Facklamia languida]